MKVGVLFIFIVIQAITCEKAVSKLRKKLMVPKMNEQCKKIKCPSIEDPLCVKMTRHDLGVTMHIMAANRCELDYMKCHDDVEAKIVPMKYCGHNAASRVENKKNKMGKHIRVKRSPKKVARDQTTEAPNETGGPNTPDKTTKRRFKGYKQNKLFESKKARLNRKKFARMQRNNLISNIISKYSVRNEINRLKKEHHADQRGRQNLGHLFSSETDSDFEINERMKLKKGIGGYKMTIDDDTDVLPNAKPRFKIGIDGRIIYLKEDSKMSPKTFIDPKKKNGRWTRYKLALNDEGIQKEQPQLSWHLDDFNIFSGESINISKESTSNQDENEVETLCPTVCPSRTVMVCGRCQHGVYKTFLSVCHMKMFICYHSDETLELISRSPCLLSAPYLSDQGMIPQGRLQEAGDDDKILRYLNCRDRGGFEKGPDGKPLDPRCNFAGNEAQRLSCPYCGGHFSSSDSLDSSDSPDSSDTSDSDFDSDSDLSSSSLSSSD